MPALPDMTWHWSCCGTPLRDPAQESLGRQDGVDVFLVPCAHCRACWLRIASLTGASIRWEPLSRSSAAMLLCATQAARTTYLSFWTRTLARPCRSPRIGETTGKLPPYLRGISTAGRIVYTVFTRIFRY